jgi:hypothetical protein
MTMSFFEGAAGTGKTTRLMAHLAELLRARPLIAHERVLALSKMHGSRRRLNSRLQKVGGLQRRFECATVDSFARRLTVRWRALSLARFGELAEGSFDARSARAGQLLEIPLVRTWVARTYPVVLADEIQDSKGPQLSILKGLSSCCHLLLAGDGYQDLDADEDNDAIAWARSTSTLTPLLEVHRTSVAGLLAAATALRAGRAFSTGTGLRLLGAPVAPLAASYAATFIAGRSQGDTVVMLSPVTPAKAPFARDVVTRLASPFEKKDGHSVGPYRLFWERSDDEELAEASRSLGLDQRSSDTVIAASEIEESTGSIGDTLRAWMDHKRKTKGALRFTVAELKNRLRRIIQQKRSHRGGPGRFSAMTVHQAKNQEFDNVIVLWPYQVTGSDERKRRMLYNAITRARKRAIVIVQNKPSKKNRLAEAPFVA